MKNTVVMCGHYNEVINAIVVMVSVDMMDNLPSLQLMAKMLFHNNPVCTHLISGLLTHNTSS